MDAVPLEKAPKVAVYVPPNAPPWDDAVTMALQYAGIQFDKVWDFEVIGGKLVGYDWLHLHHEDFTGQYSKFYLIYAGAPWLAEMVRFNTDAAKRLGFVTVPDLKKAVARKIRDYVTNGGFLFAMCTATETLHLALAAGRVDIAAAFADGTPMDPQADAKLDWSKALAFTGAHVEPNPQIASFSDIDGHQVNAGPRRQPLGAFKLFNFSAKIDPVPTMLVQSHRQVIPDFYGLTTSFVRDRLKPSDLVLADERGTVDAVLALPGIAGRGEMLLHNHPSGVLEPSGADLAVAARLHDGGVGFAIVDNAVTDCYVVVECPRPRATARIDPIDVAALLAPSGPIARALGSFEDRPSQRDMAAYVADLLNDGGVGLLEAGAGVGKSFAYLVPALVWARENGERTVVSTNTINLQEQLVGKDLPILARALGTGDHSPTFALLKGWRNYVCLSRLEQAREQGDSLFEDERRAGVGGLAAWGPPPPHGSRPPPPAHPPGGGRGRRGRRSQLSPP